MRDEYELKHGRRNPHVARLGSKGREQLVSWWSKASSNVRVLPDDVAREFPDTETTVQALRLVMRLRALRPRLRSTTRAAQRPKKRSGER
jgi:hypothetical protein